jgi:FtsZ-interacting cell division protein ZipA
MSTGLIIAIVVAALLLIALFAFVLPRARRNAQVKARERELGQRRERAAEEHRTEAAERNRQAEMAEQKARMAEAEAQRERAEAELREQRAQMHEQGMADHELVDESERDRFAGTSAMRDDEHDEPAPMREDDRAARADGTTTTTGADGRPMHEPETEYRQGREDEAAMREGRFARDDETARTDEPARRDA